MDNFLWGLGVGVVGTLALVEGGAKWLWAKILAKTSGTTTPPTTPATTDKK